MIVISDKYLPFIVLGIFYILWVLFSAATLGDRLKYGWSREEAFPEFYAMITIGVWGPVWLLYRLPLAVIAVTRHILPAMIEAGQYMKPPRRDS